MTTPEETAPGVYVQHVSAAPNSVAAVATAIPAFIGHTESAKQGDNDLTGRPTRIASLAEFTTLFGGPPSLMGAIDRRQSSADLVSTNKYMLYRALQLFYANGGGTCWIVSVAPYSQDLDVKLITAAIGALDNEPEPTMIVTPDATNLIQSDWQKVASTAINHCQTLGSRVALIDILGGGTKPSPATDPISDFRLNLAPPVGERPLSYAMAYWPWLNTSVIEAVELDYTALSAPVLKTLETELAQEAAASTDPGVAAELPGAIEVLRNAEADTTAIKRADKTLHELSRIYRDTMAQALQAANVMPPSSALAGIYKAVDESFGVWKAPANVALQSVISPTIRISEQDQQGLNEPLDGMAVNAIRNIPGRGLLVWGARTLDGNSQDWQYISVCRTVIMLEQSIKAACQRFESAANDEATWFAVASMIQNFLNAIWTQGGLTGTKPAEAYDVSVGLGSSMTTTDIAKGYMQVTVKVASAHPADFVMFSFQQEMRH